VPGALAATSSRATTSGNAIGPAMLLPGPPVRLVLASGGDGGDVVLGGVFAQAEAQAVAVVDDLVQEPGGVVVVQSVDGGAAVPGALDEAAVDEAVAIDAGSAVPERRNAGVRR